MKSKVLLFIIVLGVISSACTTQIIRLVTLEDKDYYKGREIVTKLDDNSRISVEVDSYSGDEVVFYIQIENKSGEKIFVQPRDFYVDAVDEDLVSIDARFPRFYALDPERQIRKISEDMENRKTAHAVVTGANAALALVSIVADLSDNSSENDAHQVSRDIAVWADNQTDEEIDYDASMNEYDSQKQFWKNEVLRITDLYQNDSVGGLIFIPIKKEIEYLKFTVPLASGTYTFLYKKVVSD